MKFTQEHEIPARWCGASSRRRSTRTSRSEAEYLPRMISSKKMATSACSA